MKFEKRSTDSTSINYIDLKIAKKGDVLVNGDKFIGRREVSKNGRDWVNYLFESDQGEVTAISGTGQLKYKMDVESAVQIGEKILLTHEGRETVRGTPNVHQFTLLVAVNEE